MLILIAKSLRGFPGRTLTADCFGLVVGVEGPGFPEHPRHGPRRRIPIASGVESLSAATAAAIALHAYTLRGHQ